jgi:hypothetical protein
VSYVSTYRAQLAAFDDDDVPHARLGQVEGDAGTHHAAADDHDVGRAWDGADGE